MEGKDKRACRLGPDLEDSIYIMVLSYSPALTVLLSSSSFTIFCWLCPSHESNLPI